MAEGEREMKDDPQVSSLGSWIIQVPFSDLGKMEGREGLTKKEVSCYYFLWHLGLPCTFCNHKYST